ncbi:MAG: hypothetical protein J6Q22_03965 [Prevotella sp.]|nr:hypothetical protein [Prevotella sp.]
MEIEDFTKQIKGKYKLVISVTILSGLVFPFLLNWLVMVKTSFPVAGNPDTWIAFWPSYLSAIASFGMIALTIITLYYNNKTLSNNIEQLNELKRQWEEEHKPNIVVSYNMIDNVAYLRLVNTSKTEIRNLTISGDFYVDGQKNGYFDLTILKQFNIDIEPNGIRNIIIHPNIVPISNNCYFILHLKSDNMEEKKEKVYCNDVYTIGDDIVWSKMINAINRIHK